MSWIIRLLPRVPGKIYPRLSLKHLELALQPSAVVLSRTFEVIVHPLDVGHEVGKVRPFPCQCSVLFHQTALNTLELSQHAAEFTI